MELRAIDATISANIERALKQFKSMTQLGRLLGVHRTTIKRWRTDKEKINPVDYWMLLKKIERENDYPRDWPVVGIATLSTSMIAPDSKSDILTKQEADKLIRYLETIRNPEDNYTVLIRMAEELLIHAQKMTPRILDREK